MESSSYCNSTDWTWPFWQCPVVLYPYFGWAKPAQTRVYRIDQLSTIPLSLFLVWQALLFTWNEIICKISLKMVVVWSVCGPPKIREIGFLTSHIEHLDTTKIIQIQIWHILWHEKQLSLMVWDISFIFEKVYLLKLALNLSDPQTLYTTFILHKSLQLI